MYKYGHCGHKSDGCGTTFCVGFCEQDILNLYRGLSEDIAMHAHVTGGKDGQGHHLKDKDTRRCTRVFRQKIIT